MILELCSLFLIVLHLIHPLAGNIVLLIMDSIVVPFDGDIYIVMMMMMKVMILVIMIMILVMMIMVMIVVMVCC